MHYVCFRQRGGTANVSTDAGNGSKAGGYLYPLYVCLFVCLLVIVGRRQRQIKVNFDNILFDRCNIVCFCGLLSCGLMDLLFDVSFSTISAVDETLGRPPLNKLKNNQFDAFSMSVGVKDEGCMVVVKSVGRPVSVVTSECFPRFCAGAPRGERNAENSSVAIGAGALALQQHSANPDGHEKCSYSDPRTRGCPAGARGP